VLWQEFPETLKTLFAKFLAGAPAITASCAWINDAVLTPFLANIQTFLFLLILVFVFTGNDETPGFRLGRCLGGIFCKLSYWNIGLILVV